MNINNFSLPHQLSEQLNGVQWTPIHAPYSGAYTYKVQRPDWQAYLKILPLGHREPLELYKQKLEWLQGKLPVPQVLHYVKDSSHEYLMMSAVTGKDGTHPLWKEDVSTIVKRLAQGLREVHGVNIRTPGDECPFVYLVQKSINKILRKIEEGRLNLSAMEPWYGKKVDRLWEDALQFAAGGVQEDLVFTHGDYCVPNVIFNDQGISGYIDLGDAGAGDPYRDFASIYRSLIRNFGEPWVDVFFEAYGLQDVDMDRIHFYGIVEYLLCTP